MAATPNGAPWMIALLEEQKRRGHDVSAVIAGRNGTLAPILERAGIPYEVFDFNAFSGRGTAGAFLRGLRLVALIRRLNADVVHTHLFPTIVLGRIASWIADVPLRYSMIPGPYYVECPILVDIEVGTLWADTRVIATCEYTRDLYLGLGVPPERLDLVYYGVDPATFDPDKADGTRVRKDLGIAASTPVVGLVAYFYAKPPDAPTTPPRLIGLPLKGHDVLFAAIPEVLRSFPDATFVLVGSGWGAPGEEHMSEMKELADRLGVAHAVRFAGERRDVPDVLASFDVALQTSRSENLGGSIEALLMGRPLVVSAVGGLIDSVKDGETGLTYPDADASALARAIVRLLQDRALAERLGRNGRAFMVERFSLARAVDDLERLYERDGPERLRGYRPAVIAARLAAAPFKILGLVRIARRALRLERKTHPPRSRIALVVGAAEGATWLAGHARSLRERGWDVVAVIDGGPGTLGPLLREARIPVLDLKLWLGPSRFRALRWLVHIPVAAARLARVLRANRFTVVQGHFFSSIVISRAASLIAGIPHVSMQSGPRHLEAPLTRLVDRATWWMDAVTIGGCEHTSRLYRDLGRDPRRLETVYFGCDPGAFRPRRSCAEVRRELGFSGTDEVVIHVAHFYPPMTGIQVPRATRNVDLKGREHLLDAARIVCARRPGARFLLVGGGWGEAGEAWRRRLADACAADPVLAGRVVFTGHRDDVPDLLAASNVAVQCALSENLGGTLEALVLERPVVATRVGGMPESVRHGETGLLVPPGDAGALAEALERLLASPDEAAAFGRAGRRLVLERFTLDRTISDLARIFERLGATPSAAPERP